MPSSSVIDTPNSTLLEPSLTLNLVDVRQEIGKTNDLLSVLKSGNNDKGLDGGFAPMPNQLSRFIRHMESMQSAITEAQVALRESVQLLSSAPSSAYVPASPSVIQDQELSFDCLRSALGVALRECERGRTPLMEHLRPSRNRFGLGLGDTIPEEDSDHLRESMPPLVHDDQEERSSTESMAISPPPHTLTHPDPLATIIEGNPGNDRESHAPSLQQLLEQAIMSIPDGREQVYEAEPESQISFDRKRPALSREERIKLVKARRASGPPPIPSSPGKEVKKKKSRPGLDVVQELKDVIWQVGERRRRSGRSSGPTTDTR